MREDIVHSYGDGGMLATVHMIGYLIGALVSIGASRRLAPDTLIKYGMLCTAFGLASLTFSPAMAVAGAGLFLTGAGGALNVSEANPNAVHNIPYLIRVSASQPEVPSRRS
jgi:hypothetical protein